MWLVALRQVKLSEEILMGGDEVLIMLLNLFEVQCSSETPFFRQQRLFRSLPALDTLASNLLAKVIST